MIRAAVVRPRSPGGTGDAASRVLYVGRDPAALSGYGFDLRRARDGRAAVAAFLAEGAAAVVLEVALLGEECVAVCRSLKALDAFLPVLFLAGSAGPAERVRLIEEADAVSPGDATRDELAAHVRALLRHRDRQRGLENDTRQLRRLALVDPLTELPNRRAFELELEREWRSMLRTRRPLAFLMIDIDRFKSFNDRFGHRAGDLVLRAIGTAIGAATRRCDRAFRWGGEEFAILLPETAPETARLVAERVRRAVAACGPFAVTVSIGVAVAPHVAIATREDLVELADQALREAKDGGRDRVAQARSSTVCIACSGAFELDDGTDAVFAFCRECRRAPDPDAELGVAD
jgi:diguanylate cyclase (GGDEF)-like protein